MRFWKSSKQKPTNGYVAADFCADGMPDCAHIAVLCVRRAGYRDLPAGTCANLRDHMIRLFLFVPYMFFLFSYSFPLGLFAESNFKKGKDMKRW